MIIAIDGPAGSGKTTIARQLARALGISYLDTGATYRALTLYCVEHDVDPSDGKAAAAAARKLDLQFKGETLLLSGRDVSELIRTPRIDRAISQIVAHPEVREVMVALQREIAREKDYVSEGRDVTTVVFPEAEHKFYLDADRGVRAQRRYKEMQEKGVSISKEELTRLLEKRDHADQTREVGALRQAEDATYIDTTGLNPEEVLALLKDCIEGKRV
ncbi:MAG: (d)CMP kinase [Candidatus Omnitrophica bacterium]|nr:(d)CMP kinase [Candidatus Omnitrophota bacterium]